MATVGGVVNVALLFTVTDTKSVRVEVIWLRLALGVGVEVVSTFVTAVVFAKA